jgi:hypothetical protein
MTKQQDSIGLEEKVALLFENARTELDAIDELAQEDKQKVVKDLAKHLEGMIQRDTICIEIVNQLRGRVSERFIRECLEDKYKQPQKMQNARKQKKKLSQEQGRDKSLAALAPLNWEKEEAENKEIVVTQSTNGSSIEEKGLQKNPELSPINLAGINASVWPLESNAPSEDDFNECSRCKQMDVEISELREALSGQTALITANEISSYETKFTIPKEKYPNVEEAMQSSTNSITVVFDKNGVLERAVSDILRGAGNK